MGKFPREGAGGVMRRRHSLSNPVFLSMYFLPKMGVTFRKNIFRCHGNSSLIAIL